MLSLLFAFPAGATTYYVAAAGSDSNVGTDAGHPWATIGKINAGTFSPGDSILFNRGDIWYGTSLTAGASGTSGAPITFGAYGTGADPVIKGSTLLSTGGYVLAPNTSSAIFSRSDSGTSSTDSGTRNWREQVSHLDLLSTATTITITVQASPTAAFNITGSGIGPAATAPNASAITRITWGGGNNGTTVAAGTSATSDPISYSLNNSVDQMVTIYTTARNVEYFSNNNETLWSNFSGPDQSQSASVSGYTSGGNCIISTITSIQTTQYTYRNTLGTAPVAVWENGSLMTLAANPATVDLTAKSWYYDGAYLYVHASDGSNVSSNGKSYTYATSSSPSYTTWDNAKSYLIFDGIDQAETWNTAGVTYGGIVLTGSYNIIRNLSAHDAYRHPITLYTGAANNVVANVTAYNSYSTAPIAIFGAGTTGNVVQDSTFYNDTTLQAAYPHGTEIWSVIVMHGGSTGTIVDSCLIYSTAASAGGYGILIGDSGTTATVSHSEIYGTFGWGVLNGSGGNSSLGTGSSLILFSNIIDISQANNVGMLFTGSTGDVIANNTVYGPSNGNAAISLVSSSTGALVKNNIFWTGGYVSVDASSETGAGIDYNDYYSAAGTPFNWGGTGYAFAAWKTNSGQDAHSVNSNPLLNNGAALTTAGNYSLDAGSPAIDTGVNLGTTYQLGLTPAASWPGNVSLGNQNGYGSGWEMGAYVFAVNGATVLLRGCCD